MTDEQVGPSRTWGFWATAGWGAVIAVVFVVTQLVVVLVAAAVVLARRGLAATDETAVAALTSELARHGAVLGGAAIATAVVAGGLVLVAVRLRRGLDWRSYLALCPAPLAAFCGWLGLGLVVGLLYDFAAPVFGVDKVPPFMREALRTGGGSPWLWLGVVVAGPWFEEIFCRGFLLSGWRRSALGPWGAVALISLLWTAAHLQYGPFELAWVFLLGLLLGAARLRTAALWTPFAMHALLNLVATVQALQAVR